MKLNGIRPLKRPLLIHIEVQEAIKNYIIENRLKANDALPSEGDFVNKLGVSRNSVREAVKALESIGILETRRGSGLFLRDFSFAPLLDNLPYGLMFGVSELAELLELRQALEVGLIEAAIKAMTNETLADLKNTVERMRTRAERGEEFVDDDREFHRLLFKNHGNRALLRLLDTFWIAFRRAVDFVEQDPVDLLSTYRDHAVILEAVSSRKTKAAQQALKHHYQGIQARLAVARVQAVQHKD